MRAKPDSGGIRQELRVGEVAARSGVAVSAIHFYEAKGLIRGAETRPTNAAIRAGSCGGWP